MPEPSGTRPPTAVEAQARLGELARRLREAHHLGPASQEALAEIVEELSGALSTAAVSSHELTQLATAADHLAAALHEQHDTTLLAAARDRVEEATVRAEAKAPLAAGIARRLIDALANLGI